MADSDGFLSRWSRRKVQVRQGEAATEAPPPAVVVPITPVRAELVEAPASPLTSPVQTAAEPPPTLDDVAALTKDSNYARFVAADTDPAVKNAALKKLFASDPHFNTMDGLDVYIDDYNRFEPIPRNLMRQLVNARAMGLLDDELPEQPAAHNSTLLTPDEDAALQLQPDDAAGRPGAGDSAADGADRSEGDPPDAVPPRGA